MESEPRARVLPCGDAAVLVELIADGDSDGVELCARVLGLERAVTAARIDGVVECTPGIRSLLVEVDPLRCDLDLVAAGVLALAASTPPAELSDRSWTLPVCFDESMAPDLAAVAASCGAGIAELVRTLCDAELRVAVVGHLPGLPYLVGLPPHLDMARRDTPRARVDAGAVGVAARMACVYPQASPGGWQIVGCTPARLVEPGAVEPVLLRPGDRVRIAALEADAFAAVAGHPRGGLLRIDAERAP